MTVGAKRAVVAGVLVASGLIACASLPKTTRTGTIHSIRIEQALDPAKVFAVPGDEIRWVNARSLPVQLDLVGLTRKSLSCSRGFAKLLGGIRESIELAPNGSASVCFSGPGEVKFNVRMSSALPGGRNIVGGVISISAQ